VVNGDRGNSSPELEIRRSPWPGFLAAHRRVRLHSSHFYSLEHCVRLLGFEARSRDGALGPAVMAPPWGSLTPTTGGCEGATGVGCRWIQGDGQD
jgi:hypothetical protein